MAASEGICADNPAAGLGGALAKKPVKKWWPSLKKIDALRALLLATDTAGASPTTRAASRFLALTAQRPGMIRRMKWAHVHGVDWLNPETSSPDAVWIIPAEEMKLEIEQRQDSDNDHKVPLAPQAVELLRRLRQSTGAGDFIFWSNRRSRDPISENAMNYLYKRLGYQGIHVPHGWRSSFSTYMNELYAKKPSLGISWERVIDLMLAHVQVGVSASELRYNEAKYFMMRREVAEDWATILLEGSQPIERVFSGPRRSPAP